MRLGSISAVSLGTAATPKSSKSGSNDTVSISSQAIDLRGLEDHISQLPDVNKARVTELRNQIAAGQYQINYNSLAGKILGFESDL